ncbi:probable histone acetyltransferase HAC-like 3 isoform X1 [Oryza brachyantha]|uniref:probable histone acetyltransferase HAC-like 3 isoform X1 n=2 Tax=Oryza brachyantha TaxID=4533 RepID=UPI001ADCE6C1|nr:probable histone acetyltransferase HAC-like 3 isoform X1 [Oryza brachyantha]XP_040378619.1 probable histone acetyltransferase HAC-like 3 isoform X1 [Oryza brachyantha]
MMAKTLQGMQQQYAASGFPTQQYATGGWPPSAAEILQLDNMDQDTSIFRNIIQRKIVEYLKEREEFCNLDPSFLMGIGKIIDQCLFEEADSQITYMDLETLRARSSAVLSSQSFWNSRLPWVSSAASSTLSLQQLPVMEVPVLCHDGASSGANNLPSCAYNAFSTQGCKPYDHCMVAATFAHSLADKPKKRPDILANTNFTPYMPTLPKCSLNIDVSTGHIKNHFSDFPGDAHQNDSSQPSTSGSSSSLSAVWDQTCSSATRALPMDSFSTANGQNLSINNKSVYPTTGQGPLLQQYRECEIKLECTWSQPLEQSDQSNITTGNNDLYHAKVHPYINEENKRDRCIQMKETCGPTSDHEGFCREKSSNLSNIFMHHQQGFTTNCGACSPVSKRVDKAEQTSNSTVSKPTSPISDGSSGKHYPAKRLKVDVPHLVHVNEMGAPKEQPVVNETYASAGTLQSEAMKSPTKSACCTSLGDNNSHGMDIVRLSETAVQTEEEFHYENSDFEMKDAKQTLIGPSWSARKRRGASILYALTSEELKNHLRSLNHAISQSKAPTEELLSVEGLPDQNTCNLCGMERLLFEPPPRFCALCFKIINSTGSYYVEVENGNDKSSICGKCHHLTSAKAKYEKKFSYADTDAEAEWWVQCDKCKAWQHQICALFNPKIVDPEAEYTCAKCFLKEMDNGDVDSLEPSTILGACELPRTKLSDHIEQRLSQRLVQERQLRASALGKSVDEVPGVEGLIVRVVSSADRTLQVQPRFKDFFKKEQYPGEFPYKSKAILLFQKNEGVDVCLFAMYVQEYGSACPSPNQRHVYLAYIDSVKYFRPEIKSASGEALRTFVYHEILIGYLDFCKKRGFVSCSIWTCPSTKRDDYVLYCHPTIQKMPKSDKLRSWYQNLVKKALKEGVVVERNTLSDFFLQPTNECKTNISAACLPYCDNDFWPGEAERLLEKKDDDSQKKETQLGRLLRVAKRDDRKGNLEDILLVHKLGERLRTMKEDFLMLCLQQFCKHCHHPIVSGISWVCTSCKNFYLCERCYAEELNTPLKDRHLATTKQKHSFERIEEVPLPETDDVDPTMESKYFDSRIDFLKHCQDNQYQFDTLRRAKHSTMMILYHLHDSTCSSCHHAMDQCLAWRCLVCLGCNFCDSCYKQHGESLHIHKLRQADKHPRLLQKYTLQGYLESLVHASRCFDRSCNSKLCLTLKKLFFHGVRCHTRARDGGGCHMCVFMWKLLFTHSLLCDDANCSAPRCRDIKAYIADRSMADLRICG